MRKPECAAGVACYTHPKVVGELQGEDGDALVVEGARHRAGDVAGHDGDEAGRQQPGALVPQLAGQQEGGDGGEAAEHRRQEDAHVPDVHGDVQHVEDVVDEAGGHHEAGVNLRGGERGKTLQPGMILIIIMSVRKTLVINSS